LALFQSLQSHPQTEKFNLEEAEEISEKELVGDGGGTWKR
jgi:hypothetical protein